MDIYRIPISPGCGPVPSARIADCLIDSGVYT